MPHLDLYQLLQTDLASLGGGVSDGDKGGITVAAGAWTVNDGSITSAKISPDAFGTSAGKIAQGNDARFQAFPVGAVFIAVVSTNPATILGYGTWAAIAAGRVLVGRDAADVDFDTAEEIGGSKTVASNVTVADHSSHTHTYSGVISHTHTVSITDPGHTHPERGVSNNTAGTAGIQGGSAANTTNIGATASATTGISASTAAPAGSTASATTAGPSATLTHAVTNNPTSVVQPYFVVYMWKRTA